MFDLMYEEYTDPRSGAVLKRKLSSEDVIELLKTKKRDDLLDINVVYKRQTTKGLLVIRLFSFLVDKKNKKTGEPYIGISGEPVKERVIKFQFETGTYDQRRPQGDRITSHMKFNMDVEEFAYFCDIMRSGRIMTLIRQNENAARNSGRSDAEPAYSLYKEKEGVSRTFKVYRGKSADVCIETKQSGKGGQQPDQVWVTTGLSKEEAGMLGAAGAYALETLNMWYAFGKAEENLDIINARPRSEAGGRSYQSARPARDAREQRYASRSGYGQRRDPGYAAQGGYRQQAQW